MTQGLLGCVSDVSLLKTTLGISQQWF